MVGEESEFRLKIIPMAVVAPFRNRLPDCSLEEPHSSQPDRSFRDRSLPGQISKLHCTIPG
jgi:hypothetical protein